MITVDLNLERTDVCKVLSAANPDGALLFLYLRCGNDPAQAASGLNMSQPRVDCAMALLRQLGLWQLDNRKHILPGERPAYSENDVLNAMNSDRSFASLHGEIQRMLGKILTIEETKILLGFVRYLGLEPDVICILISYCKDRARQRGNLRNPSLRTIEKEAYTWAELGIETLEDASAYIQRQNQRRSQLGKLTRLLQIQNRQLSPGEEKYAAAWLSMGFADEVLAEAYDRTCLNVGGLNWAYMNKILTRWHQAGIHTLEQLQQGDKRQGIPKGASGQLGSAELEAIQKALQEG